MAVFLAAAWANFATRDLTTRRQPGCYAIAHLAGCALPVLGHIASMMRCDLIPLDANMIRMRRTTKTWLALLSGFLLAFALGIPAAAHAGTGYAQAAPSISARNCIGGGYFTLYRYSSRPAYNYQLHGVVATNDDNLYFEESGLPDHLCQVLVPGTKNIVEIFDADAANSDDCLALNATTGYIYLHTASLCESGTASYLQWHFIPTGTRDAFSGQPLYAIQSQYVNVPNQCIYDNDTTMPATYTVCTAYRTDEFMQFDYQQPPL